jgi:methionyl-tRNA formyltransferase
MRIVFMGSAGFACPCLEQLLSSACDEVVAVVTQPDRPKGRNLEVSACPVKAYLGSRSIPVLSPAKINTPDSLAVIQGLRPDLLVVVAYGQLLRPALLAVPPLGCINVHGSLLPRYRGAAPIQWAVANGDAVSGVTTMFMNEGMDTGDMILKREVPIDSADTGGSLHDKLAKVGAALLGETVELIRSGRVPRVPQEESQATLAPKLKKADGKIDWTLPAVTIHNHVRAFNPWPGSYCIIPGSSGKTLKVLATREEPCDAAQGSPGQRVPGAVLDATGEGPLIQTGLQAIRLLEVQPEGRKPMTGAAFLRGHTPYSCFE